MQIRPGLRAGRGSGGSEVHCIVGVAIGRGCRYDRAAAAEPASVDPRLQNMLLSTIGPA
jgi:hypothetical protein